MEVHTGMRSEFQAKTGLWIISLGALALLSSLLFAGCSWKETPARPSKKGASSGGGPAVPVTAARVSRKDVPVDINAVGNVESCLTVAIKSQMSGEITRVFFREGDFVRKGEQLFSIDSRTYEGQVNQARANLVRDQAVLAQLESNLSRDQAQEIYAQSTAARSASLFERRLISKEMMEQARANADAVSAAVRASASAIQSARATVEASKATLENAKVMLSYTTIYSPLDGRTGNLQANQGNVVSANTTLITIHQVEPIYVTFSVPEARLMAIRKSQAVTVTTQDNPSTPQTGQVTFIDNEVDPTTGMIQIKGTFPNPGHRLWPGQFVRVTLRLATMSDALVVPNQVVQTGQQGPYVFVVKADRTVESRAVVTGQRVQEEVVIQSGLKEGEIVVTEGQLRLKPGSPVQITESP